MWSLREVSSRRKAFTIIEFLLGIAIISILLSSIYSLIFFTMNIKDKTDEIDLSLYKGRYAMEYIKKEILSADKIVSSSKFKELDEIFPYNIGFVTVAKERDYDTDGRIRAVNYNYRTYYQKDNELIRIAYNSPKDSLYDGRLFTGYNQVITGLKALDRSSLNEDGYIRISFQLDEENNLLIFNSHISIRCPVEF